VCVARDITIIQGPKISLDSGLLGEGEFQFNSELVLQLEYNYLIHPDSKPLGLNYFSQARMARYITELEKYGGDLAFKPKIVALNKIDALTLNQRKKKLIELNKATNSKVYEMSGVSSAGVTEILRELRKVIDKSNTPEVLDVEDKQWRP